MTELKEYTAEAVRLLSRLIATPSVSRDEKAAADVMEAFMKEHGIDSRREANNVWAVGRDYDAARPTLLLNAHIDTVKPVGTWTRDPFGPVVEDDRLYGLGSNDCGGGLVALLQAFRILEDPCNPLKEDIVNTQPHRLDNISPSNPSSLLPYNLIFYQFSEFFIIYPAILMKRCYDCHTCTFKNCHTISSFSIPFSFVRNDFR